MTNISQWGEGFTETEVTLRWISVKGKQVPTYTGEKLHVQM